MAASPEALVEFMNSLQDFVPTVPDEVTEHYLRLSGSDCKDIRLVRLVSLATQKFLAGVMHDALQMHKHRKMAPQQRLREQGYSLKDLKRDVLTMEDLAEALQEYGVNVKRPPYFADKPAGTSGTQ